LAINSFLQRTDTQEFDIATREYENLVKFLEQLEENSIFLPAILNNFGMYLGKKDQLELAVEKMKRAIEGKS
jgi:Tfp pilus assembly protein PilF